MTVSEALKRAKDELSDVPDRDVDASWIVCAAANLKRGELHFEGQRELTLKQQQTLEAILQRRKTREPLQYIFGFVPFYNIELKTDSRALIPRDETALLVETALKLAKNKDGAFLDIGTGSGAIGLAFKYNMPAFSVTAADISEAALSLARENAARLGLEVDFVKSDLFSEFQNKRFDIIASNPPYIATKDLDLLERELSFEPQNALDGGADGLDFYRDIIAQAPAQLNKGGLLIFEIGCNQASAVRFLFAQSGFSGITVLKDYSELDRIVYGFFDGGK